MICNCFISSTSAALFAFALPFLDLFVIRWLVPKVFGLFSSFILSVSFRFNHVIYQLLTLFHSYESSFVTINCGP